MALYEDIIQNTKSKNTNVNKHYIRNQKVLNIIFMVLLVSIIIADVLYIIKSNMLGIIHFSFLVMIISVSCEGAIFLILSLVRFNFENKILKFFVIITFFAPLVAYVPMMSFSDGYSILFFVIRIVLILSLIYIAKNKGKYTDLRYYIFRDIYYVLFASIFILSAVLFIFANEKRRIDYSFNKELNGYVLNEVLEGTADVDIKEGTVKIDDNALVKADNTITIPESVKDVSSNAFVGSNVDTLYVKSKEINLMAALNNSKIKNVYLENKDTKILDIDLINVNDIRFYTSKENIDAYRFNNDKYGYLFVPVCDDNEFYIVYNGTNKKIDYYHKGDTLEAPSNFNANIDGRLKFVRWYYANDPDKEVTFPITVEGNIELSAVWSQVYKFTFDYAGGTVIENETFKNNPETLELCKEDGNLILPTLYKDNYRFDGWYDEALGEDNLITSIKTEYFSDIRLKAKFSKVYKLNYHSNGGYIPDDEMNQEYIEGDEIIPATPIKTGYRFVGWYLEPEFTTKVERITEEGTELYAKFEAIEYNITFNSNGGSNENVITTYNIEMDYSLIDSAKDGYTFIGWYSDPNYQNEVENTEGLYGDLVLYAKFEVNIYVVNYNPNGGIVSKNTQNIAYDSNYELLVPTRTGYDFLGWFNNDIKFEDGKWNRLDGIQLVAKWQLSTPTINLSDDVDMVYNNNPYSLTATIDHELINDPDFSISYKWYKNDETKVISTKSSYSVVEAQDNKYYCHITIKHLGNVLEVDSDFINVNIQKAEYDLSEIVFDGHTFKFEFDGKTQMPQIDNLPKGKDGISVFVQYSYTGNFTNVEDTGTVTATFTTDSTNYNIPDSMTANVEIVRRKLDIEFDSLEFVYDGDPHKPTANLLGVIDGYPVELTYQSIVSVEAGSYDVLVNITDNDHYEIDIDSISYDIVKASYDLSNLTFNSTQFDYNGQYHLPNPTNLPVGLEVDNNNSIGAKNVSDTTVTLKFINSNDNYNTPLDLVVNITINPKLIDMSLDSTEFIYNGNVQTPTPTLNGVVNGDDCSAQVLNDSVNFGTYTFEFELIGNNKDNYQISSDYYNIKYVIKKATYDLSGLTYETTQFDYDGNSHIPTPTNLIDRLELDIVNSIGATNVSDTKATLKFINSNTNYNNVTDLEVNVTINPKKVIINVSDTELVYQKKLLLPEVELEGVINPDVVNVNILNTDSIDAGNYTVIAELTGSDSSNYVLDEENSNLAYVIQKADFDIQYIFLENTEYVYDGELHHPALDLENGKKKYYTPYQDEIVINYIDSYKNAGVYNAKVEFLIDGNSSNYVSSKTNTYLLTITKKEVKLEFDTLLFVYTEAQLHIPVINNIIGVITGDDLTITVTNNNITDVGEYVLNFGYSGSQGNNYIVNDEYKAVVVNGTREITGFTVHNYEGIYDGEEHTVTITGLEDGITAVFDKKVKNVCNNVEVKITFVSSDQNEGISTVAVGYITITPKPITVEFDTTTSLIYNGEKQIPNATLTGVISGDVVNVVIENESTNAGTYDATAILDNSNYYISNSAELTYEIEKCHVDLVWGQLDLIYSRTALKPTATVKYNDVVVNTNVIVTANNNINVGSYTATASLEDSNYIIDGETTTTYNILAKGVSLEWSNKTLVYNGEEQAPSANVTPITGDNCIVTVSGSQIVPGNYEATATLINANYKIEGSSVVSYSIVKASLGVEECNEVDYLTTVTYDGNVHGPIIKPANKYASDGSLIKYSFIGEKNAGSYYIDVVFSTDNEYYEECIVTVALVITPLEVNIVLNESELRFENTIRVPSFNATNIVQGDDVVITISNNSSIVGDYVANFKITGDSKDNYKITNTYNYSIIKGIIDMSNVTFTNTNVTYNGNSQLPASTNLPTGVLIDSDNSIGVVNVSDNSATIKFTLSGDISDNYELPNDMVVNMTVSKKELTINWITTEFGYDGNKHKPTYELVGVVNDDVVELVFNSDGDINKGIYTITATGVTNDNYHIESTTCEYEITIGTYDMSNVVIQDKTFTYDGKSHKSINVDQADLPDGVTAEYVYDSDPVYAGKYKVTIQFTGDSTNYNPIDDMEAYIIINPATITISWSNTSFTYNGSYQSPSVEITSTLIGTDTCGISVSGAKKYAGDYTASAILSNSNYTISDELATKAYKIIPKSISVTVHNGTKTGTNFTYYYDGKVRNNMYVTYDDTVLIGSDDLDITVNTSNIKAAVGTYSYTLIFDNSNYTTTNITGTVKINKTTITNISWSQTNTTELPVASFTINDESITADDIPDVDYIYYSYTTWYDSSSYVQLDGAPKTAGTNYAVYLTSTNTDNIAVSSNSIWSYNRFTYAPVQQKEIWSHDGQYNSNLFTASGNPSKNSRTFTIDDEEVAFTSGLKLESGGGSISFTTNSTKKLTIYSTGGTTVKINNVSYNVTSGSGTEITLDAGTYTITKGNGSTVVYALSLE